MACFAFRARGKGSEMKWQNSGKTQFMPHSPFYR